MTHRHPKQRLDQVWKEAELKQPFESEGAMADCAGHVLEEQRKDDGHGGVSAKRDQTDNAVEDVRPFKNLTSGR